MKIAIIDNYDSFTYNLSHLVKELGAEVTVLRNDQFELSELEPYSKIILSHPFSRPRYSLGGRSALQCHPHVCRTQTDPRCLSWSSGHRRGIRWKAGESE